MKVREIGQKIGDVDIAVPNRQTFRKAGILISIVYRLIYRVVFAAMLLGIAVMGYQYYDLSSSGAHGYHKALKGMANFGGGLALLIMLDFALEWIGKTYRAKTQHLE